MPDEIVTSLSVTEESLGGGVVKFKVTLSKTVFRFFSFKINIRTFIVDNVT